MVVSWGSSEPVVSRIMRNIKNIDADQLESIKEWIAEAIGKMKTPNTTSISPSKIRVSNHRAKLPCKIEGLVCIIHNGCKLSHNPNGNLHGAYAHGSAGHSIFVSLNPIYTASGDLADVEAGRSKFPRDILISIDHLPTSSDDWYKVNGKILETSICDGWVTAYVSGIPKDEKGFPLIPEVEEYEHAIYRYCRMMLIEAGYEDKVMSYTTAVQLWEQDSGRAISAVSFPTPDEVASSINRNVKLFGSELDDDFLNSY